jgi:hypothetical protein
MPLIASNRVRGLADRDAASAHLTTASRKYKRARLYYMAVERQMSRHDDQKMQSYDAMLETCRLSVKLSNDPVANPSAHTARLRTTPPHCRLFARNRPGFRGAAVLFRRLRANRHWPDLRVFSTCVVKRRIIDCAAGV